MKAISLDLRPSSFDLIINAIFLSLSFAIPLYRFHKGNDFGIRQINISHPLETFLELITFRLFFFILIGLLVSNFHESQRKNQSIISNKNIELSNFNLYLRRERNSINLRIKELQKENIKLEEMDKLKSIFLSSMSHELRTPLNSIIGFTGILLQGLAGELNDEQKKQLMIVKKSSQHLLSLINDLLDISKIEAGKIEFNFEKFDLIKSINEVIESFSNMSREKGLLVEKNFPSKLIVYADNRRIKQIIINLLSNAIKYTNSGQVKISVIAKYGSYIKITFSDTGIGIKPENVPKIFEPFQQINTDLTKKTEGTGLGLYLTKKLVLSMGGDIQLESQEGIGSKFTVILPKEYMVV